VAQPDHTTLSARLELPLIAPTLLDRATAPPAARPVPGELLSLLYRQMRSLAGARGDLDDLVQAAAERAVKAWPRFEGRCAVSTWTYGIAYRTLIDHDRWFRRWQRRFSFDPEGVPDSPQQTDLEGSLTELGRARRLREILAELPPAKRAVVVLAELEGKSMREVSEIVGTNERTVRSRLRDARQKLCQLLANDPLFQEARP
jgi:RNA polymerase sigma-70 factor (ECF subfamily)